MVELWLCVIIFFRVCIIALPAGGALQTFAITNSLRSAPDLSSILCCELWPLIPSVWTPYLLVSDTMAKLQRSLAPPAAPSDHRVSLLNWWGTKLTALIVHGRRLDVQGGKLISAERCSIKIFCFCKIDLWRVKLSVKCSVPMLTFYVKMFWSCFLSCNLFAPHKSPVTSKPSKSLRRLCMKEWWSASSPQKSPKDLSLLLLRLVYSFIHTVNKQFMFIKLYLFVVLLPDSCKKIKITRESLWTTNWDDKQVNKRKLIGIQLD